MMYCTNCGSPAEDGQVFCTVCGQKFEINPVQPDQNYEAPAAQQPAQGYAYGAAPQQPVQNYGYGAAPQQPVQSYGYGAAQQPAQNYAYGTAQQPAQNYGYGAAQQPAQNYIYGPDETRTAAFNWERLQPRSHPAGAGALIFALGILIAAVFLMVWGTAFISPGGLGSDETLTAEETKKHGSSSGKETTAADKTKEAPGGSSAETSAKAETQVPATLAPAQETAPGELPAAIAAKVNKSAAREDYRGSYTGTLTVDTYNLVKLAEATGAPAGQLDMYEALNGQTYNVTAEYKDGSSYVKVISNEFPYTSPGESILEGPVKEDPENGCTIKEDVVESDGYVLKNSQQVWFLSDGSLYLMNAITASKDGEFVGGMIISALLKPDK